MVKKKNNNFTHLMSFPIDSPFFPNNLVSKFLVHKDKYEIISANSGNRNHPVFSLWHLKLEEELEFCVKNGIRKMMNLREKKN